MKEINELGNRYGRLVVQERIHSGPHHERCRAKGNPAAVWRCRCDCGEDVYARGPLLRRHQIRSCGCWQQDAVAIHAARYVPPILVLEDQMAKNLITKLGRTYKKKDS